VPKTVPRGKEITYQDRHSTFDNDVRDALAIRRGAAENEVQKHKERLKVLQQNTWIDDRKFLKSCVRATVVMIEGRARQYQTPCIWHVDGALQITAN